MPQKPWKIPPNFTIEYPDNLSENQLDEAWNLQKEANIRITGRKDIANTIQNEKQETVATLWTVWHSNVFSFDIIVKKEYQNKNLGKELAKIALQQFSEEKEAYINPTCNVEVVNEKLKTILLNYFDFKIDQTILKSWIMSPK